MLNCMRRKDACDFGCTGFSLFKMAAGGQFLSGEEFDLYFDNLDFIEPDDDEVIKQTILYST